MSWNYRVTVDEITYPNVDFKEYLAKISEVTYAEEDRVGFRDDVLSVGYSSTHKEGAVKDLRIALLRMVEACDNILAGETKFFDPEDVATYEKGPGTKISAE